MKSKEIINQLKELIKSLVFSVHSAISSRVPLALFFRSNSEWFAYTHGKVIPIARPSLDSLEYYRHFFPEKGSIVFDVGGEKGVEARQLSTLIGEEGKVFIFECFPDNVEELEELARSSGNMHVINKACWNRPGPITLYKGSTPGSNTLVKESRGQRNQKLSKAGGGTITVDADTLDSMWTVHAGSKTVDFLKMDIEGAELEALEGSEKLLQATNKVVVAAYHIVNGSRTAERVRNVLENAGFRVSVDKNFHVYGERSQRIR